ncbi:MAG: DinB family protein [Pyrinomonadaceae bacterium]
MSDLSITVADGFVHCFEDFARRVQSLANDLSEENFWAKPFPYGNSFGNLVLHITGNLNYYIGTHIGNTGYVREREREFTESNLRGKEEVLRSLDAVVDLVVVTLRAETDESLTQTYEAEGVDDVKDRFGIYLRCAVHFHHHIGQMIYLVKEFSK